MNKYIISFIAVYYCNLLRFRIEPDELMIRKGGKYFCVYSGKVGIPAAAPRTMTGLTSANTCPANPTPRPCIIKHAQPPAILP